MTSKTLPNSWTALASTTTSTGEAFPLAESIMFEETGREELGQAEPNVSLPRGRETDFPHYAPRWLGTLSLAFFLGTRELELLNRHSPAYCVQLVREGSATSESPRAAARGEILADIQRVLVEDLEDGMTYDLGICVASVVQRYHELALATFAESILGGELSPEVASHTLRWLGRMNDPATESSRLRVLGRSLRAASPIVRDGAALGLAALGKREAISMLRKAVEDEPIVSLRRDLEQVLRELD